LQPDNVGLSLAEAKALLQQLQQTLVEQQSAEYLAQQSSCSDCGKKRLRKGDHEIVYRTPFGKLRLESPRLYRCGCQPHRTRTFSPLADLLKERTAPELLYLESKFSALMSYGLTTKLLEEVLPIDEALNRATVRNHLYRVAERMEGELAEEKVFFIEGGERDWKQLPQPDLPLTVGLDGGFVHSCEQKSRREGWFEVIAGKSVTAAGDSKCFAFVHNYDPKPKRRLFEVLQSQGMQYNQQIEFLSDGGDTVRELPLYLNPQSEHWLDWFHLILESAALWKANAIEAGSGAESGLECFP
jgi:hypothetical protein